MNYNIDEKELKLTQSDLNELLTGEGIVKNEFIRVLRDKYRSEIKLNFDGLLESMETGLMPKDFVAVKINEDQLNELNNGTHQFVDDILVLVEG